MNVQHIEILVEEPSMEAALRIIVPKIVEDVSHEIYPFQCKQDLLAKLPERLAGYRQWLPDDWRIVVIVDRDDDDCRGLKSRMETMCHQAGLPTCSTAGAQNVSVVNRIAIEELEAWYFGDWTAVMSAYPGVPSGIPQKAAYRDPDMIRGGTWEALQRILQRARYFETGLRKIEAARTIACHMDPSRNRSHSFLQLYRSLTSMKKAAQ